MCTGKDRPNRTTNTQTGGAGTHTRLHSTCIVPLLSCTRPYLSRHGVAHSQAMSDLCVPTHTLTLCVAHYWRGRSSDGQRNPLHWALFLISNATPESLSTSSAGREAAEQVDHWGTCYQAIGNIDTFAYSRTEYECMEILADAYRGCLPLANVELARLAEAEHLMQQVIVHRGREDWNCQNWVLAAVDKLKANGVLPPHISSDRIRSGLEDVLRKWKP